MSVSASRPYRKAAILLSFLVMVIVNALANALPLNGVQTGDVADRYQNLFTPAPLTFAIWGVIYLALLVYVVFQILPENPSADGARQAMLNRVGNLFILSSVLNAGWIFAWHYNQIALSLAIMALILLTLMRAAWLLRQPHCNPKEELTLRLPFGVYFGWITVATIANTVVWLRGLQWNGFGISDPVWTAILLVVGAAIASVTLYRIRNVGYGLAVIWAYAGILSRHVSPQWYGGQYALVIVTAAAMLAVLVAALAVSAVHMRKVAACDIRSR